MSLPVCPICEREFVPNPNKESWQKFCSTNCRRREKGRRRRTIGKSLTKHHVCKFCEQPFKSDRSTSKYCSNTCRNRGVNRDKGRVRLRCIKCGGRHMSEVCLSPKDFVRQYGTLGPNREYIPPPGVKVRVRHLPHHVFGEDMGRAR